jgi:hypothetical protein
MMRQLKISRAVQVEINNTWDMIEQEEWFLIEEKALEWLEADLAAKLAPLDWIEALPILSEALPKYIGFEDVEIDHAVFEAAFWVLGWPASRNLHVGVQWPRRDCRDTETFQHDDSIEDPLLTELDVPAVCSGSPQRITRLQAALAWGRSRSEPMNATVNVNEAALGELEIHIPRPPSSPSPSACPHAVRRRLKALREHAMP